MLASNGEKAASKRWLLDGLEASVQCIALEQFPKAALWVILICMMDYHLRVHISAL